MRNELQCYLTKHQGKMSRECGTAELSVGWVDPRVGSGRGSEKFPKILKLVVCIIMFVTCIRLYVFVNLSCLLTGFLLIVNDCSHNVSVNNAPELSSLCPKVCCWLCGVRLGCGMGWFVGPKFLLCDGLGWVEEIGPTDNSVVGPYSVFLNVSENKFSDRKRSLIPFVLSAYNVE